MNRFFGFFFAVAMIFSASKALACKLVLGWEPWAPYQMMENGKLIGYDVEFFQEVAKKAGCEVVPQEQNWTRIVEGIRNGTIDVVLAGSKTPERESFALFSKSYRSETMALFNRKGEAEKFNLTSVKDIIPAKMRLGVIKDYSYGDSFDIVAKSPEGMTLVDPVTDVAINIKKAANNRIDGFLEDDAVGLYMIKKANLSDSFEVNPIKISSSDVHFMYSKKSVTPETIEKMNKALEIFKTTPEYQALVDKYTK